MKAKLQLKLIAILVFCVGIAGIGSYIFLVQKLNQDKIATVVPDQLFGWKYPVVKFPTTGIGDIAYSDIRDPGGVPQGLPVRLKIPIIGVDAAVEDALVTPDGRMDVPAGSVDVAWFALGPHPGQAGSAVIGGHFGINNGVKFVFYDLDKLVIGDKIYIEDDKGQTLAFQVRSIKLFDRDADATSVFISNDGLAHLNVITCEGVWNQTNGVYPQRRVVFSDAIASEGAVVPPVQPVAVPPRSLTLGAKGTDVAELQTALEQKGFLTMPRGVSKGYYGALTRTSVTKYQKSVGLPANGIFGLSTRAQLFSKPVAAKPTLPSTAITPAPTPSPTHIPTTSSGGITQIVKSLYGTPIDGIITSLLLISILFVASRVIKRFTR